MSSANKSARNYSLADVICTVGPAAGVPPIDLSGYGSGGALDFEVVEDPYEATVGLDGAVAFSENLNEIVVVTITVLETTKAYRKLGRMAQAQREAAGLAGAPFFMADPNNGDEVSDDKAVFTSIPGPSKSGTAEDREFALTLPHARPEILYGSAVV